MTTTVNPLWYATRATGVMALLLLTASVLLGVATAAGTSGPGVPRVITGALHRNLSLLVLVFVAAHVMTTVLDSYTSIGLTAAFVPFSSPYRGFWLGLGAIASDLLLAVTVTSLLRDRLSYRTWRAVHWLTYASWPVALWHGLGTGTDTRLPWLLALDALCAASVLGVAGWRLTRARPGAARIVLTAAAVLLPVATIVFVAIGPLRPGWARRAGTPAALLGSHQATSSRTAGPATGAGPAPASGTPDGTGIAVSGGTVSLGAAGQEPARQGPVTQLRGRQLTAALRGPDGQAEWAHLYLVISWPHASGQLSVSNGGGA